MGNLGGDLKKNVVFDVSLGAVVFGRHVDSPKMCVMGEVRGFAVRLLVRSSGGSWVPTAPRAGFGTIGDERTAIEAETLDQTQEVTSQTMVEV